MTDQPPFSSGNISSEHAAPDADAVRAFLKANPDFLSQNPDLADQSRPDQRTNAVANQAPVVNFHQHAAKKLRADLDAAKKAKSDLLTISMSNAATLTSTHKAILAILEAADIQKLARIIRNDLPEILDVEAAALFVAGDSLPINFIAAGLQSFGGRRLNEWMLPAKTDDDGLRILLRPKVVNAREFYGDRAPFILSDALVQIPMDDHGASLLLVLGARGEGSFHPEQATDFLAFFCRVLQRQARHWLPSAATAIQAGAQNTDDNE